VADLAAGLDNALFTRLAGQRGHEVVNIDGRPQLVYAARVDGTPWMLAVVADEADALSALTRLGQTAMLSTIVFVLLASVVMAAVVGRMLRRLTLVRDALQGIASGEGDLTRRLDAQGRDELAQIAQGFNQFADKIAAVLLRIRQSAESVRLATSEIASGNQDLSSRTEGQASSLEETAAAMEELTATVQQNAANARQANQLAQEASQVQTIMSLVASGLGVGLVAGVARQAVPRGVVCLALTDNPPGFHISIALARLAGDTSRVVQRFTEHALECGASTGAPALQ